MNKPIETVCDAIYENGVLRPLIPLRLREHQPVRIRLLTENPVPSAEQTLQELAKAGLLTSPSDQPDLPPPLSDEDRLGLAERIGKVSGKTLSEIIIEDRGQP